MKNSRREFIKKSTALATSTAAPWLGSLAAMADAAAQTTNSVDYKALVCIFLFGGNDHANTLIPNTASLYAEYLKARPDFAIAQDAVAYKDGAMTALEKTGYKPASEAYKDMLPSSSLPLEKKNDITSGLALTVRSQFSLSPALTDLHGLYTSKKLAVILNVGALIEPMVGTYDGINPVQYHKHLSTVRTAAVLPPLLGSHNDQQSYWQSLGADGNQNGWGAALLQSSVTADAPVNLVLSMNTGGSPVWGEFSDPTNLISISGLPLGLADALTPPLAVFADFPELEGSFFAISQGWSRDSHPLKRDLRRKNAAVQQFRSLMTKVPKLSQETDISTFQELKDIAATDQLPEDQNLFAKQLLAVARAIKYSQDGDIGEIKRQVFFVGVPGFDTHSSTKRTHEKLLQHLSRAMLAFQRTMDGLKLSENVTTFTASDFGRTLIGNGDGSDHGWGGHHFVMGGAVQGGLVYGYEPNYSSQGLSSNHTHKTPWTSPSSVCDNGRGRLIPTISIDQYGATLAKWFGVTDQTKLEKIFPNLKNFKTTDPNLADIAKMWPQDIGFMSAATATTAA